MAIEDILSRLPEGVALAISLLLIFLGYKRGGGTAPRDDMEVAGALVDNSAIFKLASSIEQHNALMAQNQEHFRHMVDAFNRNSEELRELAREIRESVTAILRSRR